MGPMVETEAPADPVRRNMTSPGRCLVVSNMNPR